MSGLNLHGIVASAIGAVNPHQKVILKRFAGWTAIPGGERIPEYLPPVQVTAQVQPLPQDKLQFVDREQNGGLFRQMYLEGEWSGLSRAGESGGDLVYWGGYEWIINPVSEAWGALVGWTLIVVQAQRRADPPEILPSEVAP